MEDDRTDVEHDGIRSLTMFVILPRKDAMGRLLADIGGLPEVRSVRLANANAW